MSVVKPRRVLMIAYHYPPVSVSSGVHRTLKFSQYLNEFGWQPMVLSISPQAYSRVSDYQLVDIPRDMVLTRAVGFDSARTFSIKGRYPGVAALPDRWISWWPFAVWSGLRLINKYKPDVIWSTYPVATACFVGLTLQRLTKLPWVADLRDSMTEPGFPADLWQWKAHRCLEKKIIANADRVVFTTHGTRSMYLERYPEIYPEKLSVIENGFDELDFSRVEASLAEVGSRQVSAAPLTLVHSGVLYPEERDPQPFFRAVAMLKIKGVVAAGRVKMILRGTGHDSLYAPMLRDMGLDDVVELAPPLDYGQALAEILQCDGLLLFQASNCNHQIPAKLYEYVRARKPILALTDAEGDTATLLNSMGIGQIVSLDSSEDIQNALMIFIDVLRQKRGGCLSIADTKRYSRYARTAELGELLDGLVERIAL